MFAETLIVLAVATAALGNPPTLYPLPTDGKIVGGELAAPGEIPWHVGIAEQGKNFVTCSGVIINENFIVTAAHCELKPYTEVRSGEVRCHWPATSSHFPIKIVRHPLYDSANASAHEYDIAVWKVSPPFVWGSNTRPINLPAQGTETPAGTNVTVSGWGTTSYLGSQSEFLQKVDVPIVDKATCDQQYGGIPDNMICAGLPEGGKDACQGDSGGPLFISESANLHGIVSWGRRCAEAEFPGVYTEVASFTDWILENAVV